MNTTKPPTCFLCNWTNIGLLNLGEPGDEKMVCPGCCGRMLNALQAIRDYLIHLNPEHGAHAIQEIARVALLTPNRGESAQAPVADCNVEAVRRKMLARSKAGFEKYGVTTERDDLDVLQWIQHAQEEAMDMAVYLERVMSDLEKQNTHERP